MTLEDRAELAGALNAGLAHDLRNLLAIAETSVFVAKRKSSDPAALTHHLERTAGALRAAQELLSTTLAFARGEPLKTEVRQARAILEGVANALGADLAARISIDVAADPKVDVSGILLKAALVNVVKNALEATGPDGKVRIAVAEVEGRVDIAIEDDGPGFPAGATIDGLVGSSKPGGTGLGLKTASACARVHGGELSIEAPSRGARVVLRLPIAT